MREVIKNISNGCKKILTNYIFQIFIIIGIFICLVIIIYKNFNYKKENKEYRSFFTEINNKMSNKVKYNYSKENINANFKKSAANELVNCIGNNRDVDTLPDNLRNKIKEIESFFNSSNNYFSFVYEDIYSGFTLNYNENQSIYGASTIKAPTDIYIYEMASQNKINLEDKITYTSNYYIEGTGVLKDRKFNDDYSIRELVNYSIKYSDNAAHTMLINKYGRENMLNFWKDKGTTTIFTSNTAWGNLTAKDANIYMKELYRFYIENNTYGEELMSDFLSAIWKPIKSLNNKYEIANKSGWQGTAFHDAAIVYANNPYILVILSNTGESDYTMLFNTASNMFGEFHEEYWKYKMSECSQINQY